MSLLGGLERRMLGGRDPIPEPITEAKVALPTLLAAGVSMLATVLTGAVVSSYTENKWAVSFSALAADMATYNGTFILSYLGLNRERYSINGGYSIRHALYDLFFKVGPAGAASGIPIDLATAPINYSLMSFGLEPVVAVGFTKVALTLPHIGVRRGILFAGYHARKRLTEQSRE